MSTRLKRAAHPVIVARAVLDILMGCLTAVLAVLRPGGADGGSPRPRHARRHATLPLLAGAGLLLGFVHLQIDTPLTLGEQWRTLQGLAPQSVDALVYLHARWPRLLMALVLGAALALSGSLLQQLTRNPLVSPMTLGSSAGAWCAIVLGGLLLPAAWRLPVEVLALGGSLLALLLVAALVGWRQMHGLAAILAGTAVNLLLGSVASIAVMMNDQYSRSLLVWGAGDLAQNDWYWLTWLWPRLLPACLLLPLLLRPLRLMQLGSDAAAAAGLNVGRLTLIVSLLALWLSGLAISAVGLIGFVSLLAPNLARLCGAHRPGANLLYSAVLGALALLAADALALYASARLPDSLPSSAAVGLIGAPAMIWLCLRQRLVGGQAGEAPGGPRRQPLPLPVWIALCLALLAFSALCGRDAWGNWMLAWPDSGLWALRWPRLLAACAAGAGLAIAGVILQRLLNNPLASPDLLGISSGASLGMLAGLAFAPDLSPHLFATLGAAVILLALGWLAPRHAPARLILLGVALSSLLEAVLQFVLAQGNNDSFRLLNWLAGSTYHSTPAQALWLLALVIVFGALAGLASRVLLLFAIGEANARSGGLDTAAARLGLLLLVGLISVAISSQFGPMAFIGLVLPQLASLLGARRPQAQLLLAALLGTAALALADWAGRTLIFPAQLPVGALASVACGALLLLAVLKHRRI